MTQKPFPELSPKLSNNNKKQYIVFAMHFTFKVLHKQQHGEKNPLKESIRFLNKWKSFRKKKVLRSRLKTSEVCGGSR